MSNVIAKGISSTLKTAEKETIRTNIDAPSNAEMTAVENRATTLENNIGDISRVWIITPTVGYVATDHPSNAVVLTNAGLNTGAISSNSPVTLENPLAGKMVDVKLQIKHSTSGWMDAGWIFATTSYGYKAGYNSSEGIIVRVGAASTIGSSTGAGNPTASASSEFPISEIMLRVIIRPVGL